jgi:hypothetical protein
MAAQVSENALNLMFARVAIWRAHERHPQLSAPALALRIGQPVKRVRLALKLLRFTPADVLRAYSMMATKHWTRAIPIAAAKGDHKPARDLLLHTGQIQPVQADHSAGVQIVFAAVTVPGLSCFTGENVLAQNANVLTVSEAGVTDTSRSPDRGADTPGGDPVAAPANAPAIFTPETNG